MGNLVQHNTTVQKKLVAGSIKCSNYGKSFVYKNLSFYLHICKYKTRNKNINDIFNNFSYNRNLNFSESSILNTFSVLPFYNFSNCHTLKNTKK